MLDNMGATDNLKSLARIKAREYNIKTVTNSQVEDFISQGWQIKKHNKTSTQMIKRKVHHVLLEDRVWMLLYRLGFHHLSADRGAFLIINSKDPKSPKTQIDVAGIDTEVAIAFECKSQENASKRPQFQDELGKLSLARTVFAQAVNKQYPDVSKRQIILAMFTFNIILTDNDKKRAAEANIVLFDENDLLYYESLTDHLGPAAKYQFFPI